MRVLYGSSMIVVLGMFAEIGAAEQPQRKRASRLLKLRRMKHRSKPRARRQGCWVFMAE